MVSFHWQRGVRLTVGMAAVQAVLTFAHLPLRVGAGLPLFLVVHGTALLTVRPASIVLTDASQHLSMYNQ